jgi:nicotinamidase-related amidase
VKDIIRPGVDYMAFQARERREEAERAKKVEAARAQGIHQILAQDWFKPDPTEIVRLGRVPGGRDIRRV